MLRRTCCDRATGRPEPDRRPLGGQARSALGAHVIALIQRVRGAFVDVHNLRVGEIGHGLLVFVCAEPNDDEAVADKIVAKLLKLRIFADDAGKMNRSVQDVQGGLLIVPQFTLAADTSAGNRPSFTAAAPPEWAKRCIGEWSIPPAKGTRRSPAASSAPRCRCISSTTGR
jgi:D-aminoacyl-tRNA deacylase